MTTEVTPSSFFAPMYIPAGKYKPSKSSKSAKVKTEKSVKESKESKDDSSLAPGALGVLAARVSGDKTHKESKQSKDGKDGKRIKINKLRFCPNCEQLRPIQLMTIPGSDGEKCRYILTDSCNVCGHSVPLDVDKCYSFEL